MNTKIQSSSWHYTSYFGQQLCLQKQVFNQIQELPLKLSPWFGVSFPLLLPCPMCARAGRKKSKLLGRRPLIIIQELKMWRFSMLSSILHQAATAMSNWKLLALPGGVARTWHMAPDRTRRRRLPRQWKTKWKYKEPRQETTKKASKGATKVVVNTVSVHHCNNSFIDFFGRA